MIQISTDGGARGNPGPAAYGFVVKNNNKLEREGQGYIGIATNNVAEYTAVIEALKWLRIGYKGEDLEFYLDSNLVISQLSGIFKIKNSKIRDLVFQIRELETDFSRIRYNHVPREKNKEADRLVNQALDEHVRNSKH